MNKLKLSYNTIFLIATAIIFMAVGGTFGIIFQSQKDQVLINKYTGVIKSAASKTVASILSYGQISDIQGRDVTLAFGGDYITVNIKQDANVYSYSSNSANAQKKQLNFSDLKKGDTVNISMTMSQEGKFTANSVMVVSQK
jgi:hypothetical protein